jgi:glycosyltransferase involved in cell wall biosynthesis
MIDRKDLPVYFSGCDILAVPSVRDSQGNMDGLPNVLMEGLSSGCAIVASDIAGIPNVVANEVNGLLVEPKNPMALAAALEKLINNDSLRKKLGDEARKNCLNQYTWKITGSKYSTGIKSILK